MGVQAEERVLIPELVPSRPFLRHERPIYRNYAFRNFANYPNHSSPYTDQARAYYSSMANYLTTGYSLYEWSETRLPGQQYGSSLSKDMQAGAAASGLWIPVFDSMVMGRDGYGGWGYSAIVGDALIARFTPLTLSMVDFNGIRMDLSMPHLQLTLLGSRIERPKAYQETPSQWSVENTHYADDNTVLLGSRVQTQIGSLLLGLNGVNLHVYRSTQPGNSLKGVLRPDLPLVNWLIVRFKDDSPTDGAGGPVVQDVQLVVNGTARPDLRPRVIRHRQGIPTQVGSVSRATGEFRPITYYSFSGRYQSQPLYYRGRDEAPKYADYLYRFDYEEGDEAVRQEVADNTNLPGLLADYLVESPDEILHADGDELLIYMFELTSEPHLESVEVEALVGNDYRAEVSFLTGQNERARDYPSMFRTTFYQTALRAEGNVQDLSNLKRVRFSVGEHTALFTYSADMHLGVAGLEINGEYARSARYSRYPAQLDGEPIFDQASRSVEHGSAYFLNATRWFGPARAGGEYFSMNPDFQTGMRNFVDMESGLWETNLASMANTTVYWDLVEDNEDGDRYPDFRIGNLLGMPFDSQHYDPDGVFPGQDDDVDGFPDTNRNGNTTPDYEEPFLMYYVEPIDYVYGLDRNNNDQPDVREDDLDFDYPYDLDQRGYHLFGLMDLTRHWSVGVGRYAIEQVVGAGRNKSVYAQLSYRREGVARLRRLFFENHFRRVKDDIADEARLVDENPRRDRRLGYRGPEPVATGEIGPPIFGSSLRQDPLLYQDSYVGESYLEARLRPWSTLRLAQQLRLRLNWQQKGQLPSGLEQRQRRMDFWTVVSQAEFTWYWGKLSLTPQVKFMHLRLVDQQADRLANGDYTSRDLTSEFRTIPILRLEYPLMSRTMLQAGLQGLGPLPYKVEDRVRSRNSFEQHTAFFTLTNRKRYFGYDLYTAIGVTKDKKEFDDPFRQADEFDVWSFFIRTLIGFTEYGRLI